MVNVVPAACDAVTPIAMDVPRASDAAIADTRVNFFMYYVLYLSRVEPFSRKEMASSICSHTPLPFRR
jgi:hypothetical protein